MPKKIKIAVVGTGNVGQAAISGIKQSEDMEICGVISRTPEQIKNIKDIKIVGDISELGSPSEIDVVILATPSHIIPELSMGYLSKGYTIVDSFDDHPKIPALTEKNNAFAKDKKAVSIVGAGWDPGADSIIRNILTALAPHAAPKTTFGPGRSMGHTTDIKSMPGVVDAVSITLPGGYRKGEDHIVYGTLDREAYVVAAPDADKAKLEKMILEHPHFKNDGSKVIFVDNIAEYNTVEHGGIVSVEDESSKTVSVFKIHGNNPRMTADILIGTARAASRLKEKAQYGCYTLVEIPLLEMVPGETRTDRLAKVKY